MCFLLEVFKFYVISARSWSNLTLIICLGFVLFISPHWARHCRGIAVVATVRWGIVCGNNHLNQLNPHLDPANCPSQGPGFGGWTPDVVYGWGLSPMGSHTPWIPMNSIESIMESPGRTRWQIHLRFDSIHINSPVSWGRLKLTTMQWPAKPVDSHFCFGRHSAYSLAIFRFLF